MCNAVTRRAQDVRRVQGARVCFLVCCAWGAMCEHVGRGVRSCGRGVWSFSSCAVRRGGVCLVSV